MNELHQQLGIKYTEILAERNEWISVVLEYIDLFSHLIIV